MYYVESVNILGYTKLSNGKRIMLDQDATTLNLELFSGNEVRALNRPLEFLHGNRGKPCRHGARFVYSGIVMLEQVWISLDSSSEGKVSCYSIKKTFYTTVCFQPVATVWGRITYGCEGRVRKWPHKHVWPCISNNVKININANLTSLSLTVLYASPPPLWMFLKKAGGGNQASVSTRYHDYTVQHLERHEY